MSLNGLPENREFLENTETLALDVEGSGTHIGTSTLYGFSVACEPSGACYADINSQYFRNLLSDPNKLYIAHNAK